MTSTISTASNFSPIPGPKVLLLGGPGSGKTYAIRTLLDAGVKKIGVIFTEPGMETLSDIPAEKLAWKYIRPATASWDTMLSQAKKINTLSLEALAKMSDMDKRQYTQFMDFYSACANFVDDRTGEVLGPVDSWGTDRALVIDSLTGVNIMAMKLVTGGKPVKSQADWQIAMENVEQLLIKLTTDVYCTVVMTAHLEREQDELTGGTTIMVSTLGRKLAPRVPRFFSDCIHVKREADRFTWSTATSNADLKTRSLKIADNLPPSFAPLLASWAARGGTFAPDVPAVS